jgi:FkbM family methyltransferase
VHFHRRLLGSVEVPVWLDGFRILVNPQDNCGGSLYYRGRYEPEETACFTRLLHCVNPSIFVDIGANLGYYTLTAVRQGVPRVIAIEASPPIAASLQHTVALNALTDRVRVVAAAMSDREGVFPFWLNRQEHNFGTGSLVRRADFGVAAGDCVPVWCHSGDELLAPIRAGPVLVKIDVEGAELIVLRGIRRFIARLRPTLTIEIHPFQLAALGQSPVEVITLLRGLDFRLTRLDRARETELSEADSFGASISWLIARPR